MIEPNHYEANSEFRFIYSEIKDHMEELNSFLGYIHKFVSSAENKLRKDLKLYSEDFFEYYYAGSYGETFRQSFIVTISSVAEAYIKCYVNTWIDLLKVNAEHIKPNHGSLDYLKDAEKKIFKAGINFSKQEISDFKGLLAIRNSIVHSSGNLEFVTKYIPTIKMMAKKYPSIQLINNDLIITTEQFCHDSFGIVKRFFFYLFKLALRKFPNYIADKPNDEAEEELQVT